LNLVRAVFSISNTVIANLLAFVILTPVTYFAYWAYVHYIERRGITELGRSEAAREIGLGSFIGFGLFAIVIAVLWLLGVYRVNGISFAFLPVLGALAGAFVSAFAQELIFRAVIYRITEEWLGTWWAVVISAILFGLIHLSSAGATLLSAASVALEAGVLFAAAYALTHRLWLALGIHAMWDFANDGVFGVGLAGQSGQSLHGLLQASLNGPNLLTGGTFGVEASLITLVVTSIAGFLILWQAFRSGHFVYRRNNPSRSDIRVAGSESK
jgi:membrane protease YdiL (CAAX protease family)